MLHFDRFPHLWACAALFVAAPSFAQDPFEPRMEAFPPRPIAPEPHPFTIDLRVSTWAIPITFKAGILDNLDIHIGFEPIIHEREDDRASGGGTRTISRGFGDVILRTKYNLWGNDELVRDTAFSLMPFVFIPTKRIDGSRPLEAGLLAPFAYFPWEGLDIEWTPGFAAVRGIDTSRHVFEFSSQLVFNQELKDGVIGFFEFGSAVTSERGLRWAGVLGVGLTFEPTADLVIEPAAHFGVTSAADDLVLSLTFVLRF